MLETHKKKTNIGVGLGLALQIAGRMLFGSESSATSALGVVLIVAGLAALAWGCSMYAQGKGHHPAMGLLGLLSLIGLLILVAMEDRHPENAARSVAQGPAPTNEPAK